MRAADITNRPLLYAKAGLFALLAAMASVLIVLGQRPSSTILLLLLVIWASARAYYFAFYVIEHYADPSFRYSGIGSVLAYLLRRRRAHVE